MTVDPRVVREGEVYVDSRDPRDPRAQRAFRDHKERGENPAPPETPDSVDHQEQQVPREKTEKPVIPAPLVPTVSQEFQERGVSPVFKGSLDHLDRAVQPENEDRLVPQGNLDHRDHKDHLENEETREIPVLWDCPETLVIRDREAHVEIGVLGVWREMTEFLVKGALRE